MNGFGGKISPVDIVKQVSTTSPEHLSTQNPTVLSCGGMYIPQRAVSSTRLPQYHILNVANDQESAKVVSGGGPRNILRQLMAKESMN